jgi:hypothetical protein
MLYCPAMPGQPKLPYSFAPRPQPKTKAAGDTTLSRMIAALSLSAWRARGRRRFWGLLAAIAVAVHVLAMAAHQPPALAHATTPDLHADCSSGDAPAEPHHGGGPVRHHMPPCPICQSLQVSAPPPQAPLIVASAWAVAVTTVPAADPLPPPRLVLTDLNPRGPPVPG